MSLEILGVDFGRVIVEPFAAPVAEGVFQAIDDSSPIVEGAFEALKRLREKRFFRVYVVSYVPVGTEKIVWSWLDVNNFYQATGLTKDQVYLCPNRKDKATICQKLRVTHFIDDRLEVLKYLHEVGITNLYLFRGREEEVLEHFAMLGYVKTVGSWQDVLEWLL